MAEFRRDFRAAPVPIRLSCPFSNGITLNYYARAMSCNGRVLRVLSVNPFDRELQLFVAAPFISGISRCLVASVTRSKRQASSFEIDLRFVESPVLIPRSEDNPETVAALQESVNEAVSAAAIAHTAAELAVALQSSIGIPFAKAFAQLKDQDHHLELLALISAVVNLTSRKGISSANLVSETLRRCPPRQVQVSAVSQERECVSNRRAR